MVTPVDRHEAVAHGQAAHHAVDVALVEFGPTSKEGHQFVRLMRGAYKGRFQSLPIIMLSGDADKALPGMARDLEADAFCRKPIDCSRLASKMRYVLSDVLDDEGHSLKTDYTVPAGAMAAPQVLVH